MGGPYSWDSYFSVSLTRQFVHHDSDGEYQNMEQLRMDCKYDPETVSIGFGHEWFEVSTVEAFILKVLSSNVAVTARKLEMKTIDFYLYDV